MVNPALLDPMHVSMLASLPKVCHGYLQAAARVSAIATGPRPPPSSDPGTVGTDEPLRIELGDGPGAPSGKGPRTSLLYSSAFKARCAVVGRRLKPCSVAFAINTLQRQQHRAQTDQPTSGRSALSARLS